MSKQRSDSALDTKLCHEQGPLSQETRRLILDEVWDVGGSHFKVAEDVDAYDAYFQEYQRRYEQLPYPGLADWSHRHILVVVGLLKNVTRSRTAIIEDVRQALSNSVASRSEKVLEDAVALAANLWLMMDVHDWEGDQALQDFICARLLSAPVLTDSFRLPKAFNARNLGKVAGMDIFWTSDLTQHLTLRNDDTKVALFHHVSLLELHHASESKVLPQDFVEETFRTLALLVPYSDLKVRRWYKAIRKELHLDPKAGSCTYLRAGERKIDQFKYWRDRLIMIKETYDDHEPRGLVQFWRDDRKTAQWWTFWIAIAVFFFAVVQCTVGALQVYKAYHPSKDGN
ncbi:MAG: hypothetical protein M1833_006351 [Piccolia ochrophora]|nr:MAG: hypothetical protein M1833_006351 [Piccolia ochrophora]